MTAYRLAFHTATLETVAARVGATAVAALVAFLLFPGNAAAQELQDSRWLPWIGCWAEADAMAPDGDGAAGPVATVCVVPAGEGVELMRFVEGTETGRRTVIADGQRRRVSEPGCDDGWESAVWSADGRRVLLRSEQRCGAAERVASGVISMLPRDEWVEVEVVDAAGVQAARAAYYEPAAPPAAVATRVDGFVQGRAMAIETARLAASRHMSPDDVIEVVRVAGPDAVELYLLHRGQGFDLDGATLVHLARAGVPGRVTDLMIALSYPDRFVVAAGQVTLLEPVVETDPRARGRRGPRPLRYDCLFGVAPYGWYGFRPLYWSHGGYGWSRASTIGYGCPGFYGGAYGWYPRSYWPIVVDRSRAPSGRFVQGRGFARNDSGTDGPRAVPRGQGAQPAAGSGGRPAVSGEGRSGSGSRPAVTRSGARGSSDRSGTRRAQPRGNNDD